MTLLLRSGAGQKRQPASDTSVGDDAAHSAHYRGHGRIRCVYDVCIARVSVYLPDELAERAKRAGVSISTVTQDALRSALSAMDTNTWLDRLDQHAGAQVGHEHVLAALDDAREDFGARSAG